MTHAAQTVKPGMIARTMGTPTVAMREGVSDEAAARMADMKKQDMAEAAEQLLAATDWLPALLRTEQPLRERSDQPADVTEAVPEVYSVAAE